MVKKRRKQSDRTGKSSLAIEFPDGLLDLIKQAAVKQERSIAFVVRRACRFWIQNSGEASILLSEAERNSEEAQGGGPAVAYPEQSARAREGTNGMSEVKE